MKTTVLLDTGPLVAYLDRRDQYHSWSLDRWSEVKPPFLTCEAVIAEACFLLRKFPDAKHAIMSLIRREIVTISFQLQEQIRRTDHLLGKYGDLPISLADACLVQMSELHPNSTVMTLDSGFHVYRRHGRQVIPTIMPNG